MLASSGRVWHGQPWQLDPVHQWVAENFPPGSRGFVAVADDGLWRCFDPADPRGWACLAEWKSNGNTLSPADTRSLQAVAAGRMRAPLVVRCTGGEIPSPLWHWPEPCPTCGAPGPEPTIAAAVMMGPIGAVARPVPAGDLADTAMGYIREGRLP
jgi:hypothetical protein